MLAVMLKNVESDGYTVSKLVLVDQNSTNFVCQMMAAMVDPIFRNLFNRLLTFTAFCSWGVGLFCGGSQARGWKQLGSCSCSKFSEGWRMLMDTSTVQYCGPILHQDLSGIVPT